MSLTFEQVEQALPYDVCEIIMKKVQESERINQMTVMSEKDASMITGFDKVRIIQFIDHKAMTMECFTDLLKVLEKLKNNDENKYREFQYAVKRALFERLQFRRGWHSKIMKHLTDDEFSSIPDFFTNISAYQNKFVPQIRLANTYNHYLTNIYSEKSDYNLSIQEGTPMYTAFEKIFKTETNPGSLCR
jgi:hypothetical protein